MAQILDPLPNDKNSSILCCYVNATSQIQIARITNVPNWYFERVVFPGQRLVFEADPIAVVEIHSGMMASAILSDTIPCQKLALQKIEQDQDKAKSQITTKRKKNSNVSASNITQDDGVSVSINVAV
jgi:hypothetical protein